MKNVLRADLALIIGKKYQRYLFLDNFSLPLKAITYRGIKYRVFNYTYITYDTFAKNYIKLLKEPI
jgi:hypothetical protein